MSTVEPEPETVRVASVAAPQPVVVESEPRGSAVPGAIAFIAGILAIVIAYGFGVVVQFIRLDPALDPATSITATVLAVVAVIVGLVGLFIPRGRAMTGFGLALGIVTLALIVSNAFTYMVEGQAADFGTGLRYTFGFYDDAFWDFSN